MSKFNIKSMKLYNNVDRIYNELKEIGKNNASFLKVKDLIKFDQLHYCGTEAIDFAIKKTKINYKKTVLEIGSGIGGPARYIAYKTKANVSAIEIQNDQNKIAEELTRKCKLSKKIENIHGDILNYNWKNKKFDILTSWLSLYHIGNQKKLLNNCYNLIKNNGYFYTEDLISQKINNRKDINELSKEIYANYLPTYEVYIKQLEKYGFKIISHKNMSGKWKKFVKNRKQIYEKNKNRNIRVHGKKTYENIKYFYNIVDKHFEKNSIGGIRIIAKKILK